MEPFPHIKFDIFFQSFNSSNGKGDISNLRAIYRIYIACDNYAQCSLSEYMFEVASTDSKVHGANMGLTRVLSAPDGPHVGPMNLAIKVIIFMSS